MDNRKVLSSFAYKFFERLAVKGIGLVVSLLLARLLAPEVFGSLALINVFINLAQVFVQSGLGTALVQNKTADSKDYSTVFYISLAIASVAAIILCITAPLIADYYSSPELVQPLRVLTISLFFGSFNLVQTAKLQREMRFKEMMRCNLIATAVSGAVGIGMAWAGFGLWALVFYHLSQILMVSILMIHLAHWMPKMEFSVPRAKELMGFGWKMLVSSLITSIYQEITTLIIGKKYSKSDLAFYNRGQQIPHVLANTLDTSVQAVMLPVMSTVQEKKEQLINLLRTSIQMSIFMVAPVMIGTAVVASTLIPLLLTDKWNQSIPFLQCFCVAYVVMPIQSANLSLVKAMGRSDVYMKLEAIRRIIMLATLALTVLAFNSILAIVIGVMIGAWVDAIVICFATKTLIGYGPIKQFESIWRTVAASAVMAAVVYVIGMLPLSRILLLTLQVVCGAAIYVGLAFILKNPSAYRVLSIAKKMMHRQ